MPFFTASTAKPLNLLFCISNFYKENSKTMLLNALSLLFKHYSKNSKLDQFSMVEFSEGFTSIFLGDAKEMLKNDGDHRVSVVSIKDLPGMLSNMAIEKRFSFFSLKTLQNHELLRFAVITTNGSLELAQVASFFLEKDKEVDGIIALGIIKKGGTDHDKYIASETFRSLSKLSMKFSIPVTNGIITTGNEELIKERLAPYGKNALETCLDIIAVKHKIETLFN